VDPNGALNDVFYGCYTHRLCINESSTLLNTVNSWFYDVNYRCTSKGNGTMNITTVSHCL